MNFKLPLFFVVLCVAVLVIKEASCSPKPLKVEEVVKIRAKRGVIDRTTTYIGEVVTFIGTVTRFSFDTLWFSLSWVPGFGYLYPTTTTIAPPTVAPPTAAPPTVALPAVTPSAVTPSNVAPPAVSPPTVAPPTTAPPTPPTTRF